VENIVYDVKLMLLMCIYFVTI